MSLNFVCQEKEERIKKKEKWKKELDLLFFPLETDSTEGEKKKAKSLREGRGGDGPLEPSGWKAARGGERRGRRKGEKRAAPASDAKKKGERGGGGGARGGRGRRGQAEDSSE